MAESHRHPFSLCYWPFTIGLWLILSIGAVIDTPTEPDAPIPFTGVSFILFSTFIMTPLIAAFTGLIVSGWIQYRLGDRLTYDVRWNSIFFVGLLTPPIMYLVISGLMLFATPLGDSLEWMIPAAGFATLWVLAEVIVRAFSRTIHTQSDIAG